MSTHPIHVFSEIGKLKKVCLHRPGKELENLMPDYLERLLFDDIPFLEDAQKEHDNFAQALRNEGIEVLYLEQLAAESLTSPEIRDQFIEEYLEEANIRGRQTKIAIRELLHSIEDNQELVEKTMAGFQKAELPEIPEAALNLFFRPQVCRLCKRLSLLNGTVRKPIFLCSLQILKPPLNSFQNQHNTNLYLSRRQVRGNLCKIRDMTCLQPLLPKLLSLRC